MASLELKPLDITPDNPNSGDIVTITVTTPGCGTYATFQDNNPIFTITKHEGGLCFMQPFSQSSFEVGPLDAGQYTINGDMGLLSFNVGQAQSPTAVPSMSFLGLIMLSTLLVITGKRYVKPN